jgi:hypothetical protein
MNTRTPRNSEGQFYSWNDVNSESRNYGRTEGVIASVLTTLLFVGIAYGCRKIQEKWFKD